MIGRLLSRSLWLKRKSDYTEEFKRKSSTEPEAWIIKWAFGFTFVIVILWPVLTSCGQFSKGYFTFWAVISIAWGTVGSAVIIALPLMESWRTIQSVLNGMFTNDRVMEKLEDLNSKLNAFIIAMPEVERVYLLDRERSKKKEASESDQIVSSPNH
ncbi:urea active transporter [Datura stramonium]|uniref:Urea active transporter n=1 Tax=Datura stramonium TaxID=4076 RepID=A0ABS8S203_DATST|nr:urea active transporter [Datura stramonium]